MTKKRNSEQTIAQILNVSSKLFFEKGYDKTSLQDILDNLNGLSKGAVYHHFKSKEDIFDRIASQIGEHNLEIFLKIKCDSNLTGLEKLKTIVKVNNVSESTKKMVKTCPNLLENPKFLAIQMQQIQDVITPKYFFPIVEEGISDGTIKTDKPYELAELISIIVNVWINPLVFGGCTEKIRNKCELANDVLQKYNIKLFDESVIHDLEAL